MQLLGGIGFIFLGIEMIITGKWSSFYLIYVSNFEGYNMSMVLEWVLIGLLSHKAGL